MNNRLRHYGWRRVCGFSKFEILFPPTVVLFLICLFASPVMASENLLRNGSFEGALLYWHGINTDTQRLVRDAKCGEFALRIEKHSVMSSPFICEYGKNYTVSFFVKGEKPCNVSVQMPPSARETAHEAGRLWTREAAKTAKVGTDWQRVSFTWPANIKQNGFWPNPHYMVLIESHDGTIIVDGVTVTMGDNGTENYIPHSDVEIVAECPDLPGYEGGKANLFEKGAVVRMTAHVSNPGIAARDMVLRWQFFDYEGKRAVSKPAEIRIRLEAGKTVSKTLPLKLIANGCIIARVSVYDKSFTVSSDLPLTSLPYPKSATKPDWRERFGGSFAGGSGCVEKMQKLGFGWIRWRPHMNGEDHWPKQNEPIRFFDAELDNQESHGCSTHCVLYPPPGWIMDKGNPLPVDMRWAADDAKWDDLSVEATWDKFVKTAVTHYKGRSLIYEIENEPDLGNWTKHKAEYARFTIRTAKLIRKTDPKAKIMVNNVYGIPSAENAEFFRAGGLKFIDVMSWHDYHEGWLTDATAIRRMRQNMDEAGGGSVEIWFNEGWAFSNTAVDEPIACTHLTSAQSCNAIMDSVAEMTVAGQKKTIIFHTAYEEHGMSFWDYCGPGTMLWDWYNYPLPLVAAWNVMNHHIGLSEEVGFVRPPEANFCIFDDLRNGRGVMIAYADRSAANDVVVNLPYFGTSLIAEDIMGNAVEARNALTLSKTGRPVILYSTKKMPGRLFLEKLTPLDRKNLGFASTKDGLRSWSLPQVWEGTKEGSSDAGTVLAYGKPIWKLEQVWPPDPVKKANYRPLVWRDAWWRVTDGEFGGQPKAEKKDDGLRMEFRGAHGQPMAERLCCLCFIAPETATYTIAGNASLKIWEGDMPVKLAIMHKADNGVTETRSIDLKSNKAVSFSGITVTLADGDELVFLARPGGAYKGGEVIIRDLVIAVGR